MRTISRALPILFFSISLTACSQVQVVTEPAPIDVPAPLLDPVPEPALQGQTVEAVGRFIADGTAALREANGRILATCRIVAEHNRTAGAAGPDCDEAGPR